jgi:hypothetical protein
VELRVSAALEASLRVPAMETPELSPAPLAATAETTGLNFYRPRWRVVLLLLLAPVAYELWWYWQLFTFTRREGFPRSRSFWWLFVPIYGWVVLHRQFDDIEEAATGLGASTLAIWLVVLSWAAGNISYRITSPVPALVAFAVSDLLIATVGALVQPTANTYLRNRYQDASPLAMTWGETVAAILGVLLFVAVVGLTFA